jgi:hypothetical protein
MPFNEAIERNGPEMVRLSILDQLNIDISTKITEIKERRKEVKALKRHLDNQEMRLELLGQCIRETISGTPVQFQIEPSFLRILL